MFGHILVPLDGSPRAEHVLPVAARIARASKGTITLLHVVNSNWNMPMYGMEAPFIPRDIIEDNLVADQRYLDRIAQRSDLEGVSIKKSVLQGDPALVILAQAQEDAIDLIAMSSHGYTGIKRWMLGSIAEKVARYASVPVFMLRDKEPLHTHWSLDGTCSVRALIPLDASSRSHASILPAASLLTAFASPGYGHIHLTQMVVPPLKTSIQVQEELLQATSLHLERVREETRHRLVAELGPDLAPGVTCAASLETDIAEGIVRIAERGGRAAPSSRTPVYDLIAITTHGESGIQKWAVGSITERVLKTSQLPMLIVRPADMIAPEGQEKGQAVEAVV